jgi:hypothetical protein
VALRRDLTNVPVVRHLSPSAVRTLSVPIAGSTHTPITGHNCPPREASTRLSDRVNGQRTNPAHGRADTGPAARVDR